MKNKNDKFKKISKVVVDRDLCIGAAPCVSISPKAFELDNEGKAVVKKTYNTVSDNELIIAAQSCPVQAIFLYDKNGKQIFP